MQININISITTDKEGNLKAVVTQPKEAKPLLQGYSCDVELLNNKLILSPDAIKKLDAQIGDRINIVYDKKDGKFIPCIQKDEEGNKLSSAGTIICKGVNNIELSKYGKCFTMKQSRLVGAFELVDETIDQTQEETPDFIEEEFDDLIVDDKQDKPDYNFNEIKL